MNVKRWMALLLALTMAASLFAGCAKRENQPAQPEEDKNQQQTPAEEDGEDTKDPENMNEAQKDETQKPSEETKPAEEEPEIELTPEQKLRRSIEARVAEAAVWARDRAYDNTLTEETVRSKLVQFLFENWDSSETAVSSYLEAEDGRVNLYQNSFDEYFCVLSHTDTFRELTIRIDADGAAVAAIGTDAAKASVSQEIAALVDGAAFDKRYDGYYFDDKMDAEENKAFRDEAALALAAFKTTLEEHKTDWKPVLDDAFQTTVSFDENDQFVFELQGSTAYWLELRYRPECGGWSDVSLILNEEEVWEPDAQKLTDAYLLSLVTPLELGMTAEPFTFRKAGELSQTQLWLMYLLLTPQAELEAAYRKEDGMYHVASDEMDRTLSKYLKGYSLDISKDVNYDEKTGEIAAWTVSGFGGGRLSKLREKNVAGNTVTFTVDYYAGDDVQYTAPEYAKTYTITFRYGGYCYDAAEEAV